MINDRPGVIAPPPLIFGIGMGLGFLMTWLLPLPWFPGQLAMRSAIGWLFIGVGFGVAIWSLYTMHHAGTHVDPNRPTTIIVDSGPYRYTRNPIYLSMVGVEIGLGWIFATLWIWIFLVPELLIIQTGVIAREERYLTEKFGNTYRDYQRRVRRWL